MAWYPEYRIMLIFTVPEVMPYFRAKTIYYSPFMRAILLKKAVPDIRLPVIRTIILTVFIKRVDQDEQFSFQGNDTRLSRFAIIFKPVKISL